MESSISQTDRIAVLHTPLDMDVLGLVEATGQESVNDLFEFSVRAYAPDPSKVDLGQIIGKSCSIQIRTVDGSDRWLDGIAVGASPLGQEPVGGATYEIELRPWLWLAGLRRRSRIFHNMRITEIIAAVFSDYHSITTNTHEFKVRPENDPKREYAVQYRESDLDFVRRLLEEYGINFHFRMGQGEHVMVMSDEASAFMPLSGGVRPFYAVQQQARSDSEHFSTWLIRNSVTTDAIRLTDFNPEKPNAAMQVTRSASAQEFSVKLEEYDHPGGYSTAADGAPIAQRRLDAHRSHAERISAAGDVVSLGAGMTVVLSEHPDSLQNGLFVALLCRHHYTAEGYRSGSQGGTTSYAGSYELVRADAPLAPLRRTPLSRVFGPLTGIVMGKGEIDVDEMGRILVLFHWDEDRVGSMRCRVSQSLAGKGWGALFIPRVGMEVVVEFLDGDPDRPLVSGCVYNGANETPFRLPAQETVSGWKTKSTGGSGFNQISFDDKGGAEKVQVHAQRNLELTVLKDMTEKVKGAVSREIDQSRAVDIGGSDKLTAKQDIVITSDTKIKLQVGNSSIEIDGMKIKLTASMIELDAKAELKTNSGLMAEHAADGIMTIRGAMVMINS